MTVKELIEELQRYDSDLIVLTQSSEDSYAPCPALTKHDFDYSYWEGVQLKFVPKGQSFLTI